MKISRLDWAALLVVFGQAAAAAYVWFDGKAGPLPMHYGLSGHVDRWGDRHELALVMAGLTALNAGLYLALPPMARGRSLNAGEIGMVYARASLLAVTSTITLLLLAMGFGLTDLPGPTALPNTMGRVMMGFLALIMLVTGALLGKVGPNPFVGVRTYWALRSRQAWDRSNRLAGRLWFWLGLLALIATPLTPQPGGALALVALMMASVALAAVESWRVWRNDPDRAAS